MTYRVIHTDGTETALAVAGRRPSLEELQAAVGGYIELVRVKGGELWVNEDGLSLQLPPNPAASLIAGVYIVGPAVLALRARRGGQPV